MWQHALLCQSGFFSQSSTVQLHNMLKLMPLQCILSVQSLQRHCQVSHLLHWCCRSLASLKRFPCPELHQMLTCPPTWPASQLPHKLQPPSPLVHSSQQLLQSLHTSPTPLANPLATASRPLATKARSNRISKLEMLQQLLQPSQQQAADLLLPQARQGSRTAEQQALQLKGPSLLLCHARLCLSRWTGLPSGITRGLTVGMGPVRVHSQLPALRWAVAASMYAVLDLTEWTA